MLHSAGITAAASERDLPRSGGGWGLCIPPPLQGHGPHREITASCTPCASRTSLLFPQSPDRRVPTTAFPIPLQNTAPCTAQGRHSDLHHPPPPPLPITPPMGQTTFRLCRMESSSRPTTPPAAPPHSRQLHAVNPSQNPATHRCNPSSKATRNQLTTPPPHPPNPYNTNVSPRRTSPPRSPRDVNPCKKNIISIYLPIGQVYSTVVFISLQALKQDSLVRSQESATLASLGRSHKVCTHPQHPLH